MQNLGFRHLHLVAPRGYDRERANVTARGAAEPLLDAATIHDDLDHALCSMQEVVGFALPEGDPPPPNLVFLPPWARDLPVRSEKRTTALVFGREDNGLSHEHLEQCRWIVRIPSTPAFPSFNLAQSVLLALYEIAQAFGGSVSAPAASAAPRDAPTWNEFFQLDRLLDSVMAQSGFVRPGTPEPVPGTVRNLFRRLPLDRREMSILLALFSRLDRTLLRRPEQHGE